MKYLPFLFLIACDTSMTSNTRLELRSCQEQQRTYMNKAECESVVKAGVSVSNASSKIVDTETLENMLASMLCWKVGSAEH